MSEKALWDWLANRLPVPGHYSRIESETSPGFPDVSYTFRGMTGTFELKDSKRPKSLMPFRTGGLRDTQKSWIEEELENGGRVDLIVRVDPWVYVLPGSHWALLENFEPSNPKHKKFFFRRFSVRPNEDSTVPDCRTFLTELMLRMY